MAKASNNRFPQIVLTEQATPPTPATALSDGEWLLYMDTDDKLYKVDHTATATEVGGSGGTVATGAELDTGTDNTKFASAKAINDSHNVPSVAPSTIGNVMTSNGTDWVSSAPAAAAATGSLIVTWAGSTTTAGQNQNRTSSGTYTTHAANITLYQPIKLNSVKWDVSSAKTYTLKLYRGWQQTTLHTNLGDQTAAGRTAELTWSASDIFLPAGKWTLELTWTGAAVVDDNTTDSSATNPNAFSFFEIGRTIYGTSGDSAFSAAIKLVAYLGTETVTA